MADANVAVAEPTKKARKPRKDYGIPNSEFISVWNAAESPAQVAEKLSNPTRGTIEVSYVSARAATMRANGFVTLKSFRGPGVTGRPADKADIVNTQAAYLAAQQKVEQGTPEYQKIVDDIKAKIEASAKERAENAAKRKAAKEAKKAAEPAATAA
jgi:hypothetical protein